MSESRVVEWSGEVQWIGSGIAAVPTGTEDGDTSRVRVGADELVEMPAVGRVELTERQLGQLDALAKCRLCSVGRHDLCSAGRELGTGCDCARDAPIAHVPDRSRLYHGSREVLTGDTRDTPRGIETSIWYRDLGSGSGIRYVPARELSLEPCRSRAEITPQLEEQER